MEKKTHLLLQEILKKLVPYRSRAAYYLAQIEQGNFTDTQWTDLMIRLAESIQEVKKTSLRQQLSDKYTLLQKLSEHEQTVHDQELQEAEELLVSFEHGSRTARA